jgi:autotransporter-associated beta strand protein
MNAIRSAGWRVTASRHNILTYSIAAILAPAITLLAGLGAARANDTLTFSGGHLTDTLGATSDVSTVSTTTSGANLRVTGTGLGTLSFAGVTQVNIDFSAADQTVTLDSTDFTFTPPVSIAASSGDTSDSVVIDGNHTITFTGLSAYGGGTAVNGGVLLVNNGAALGVGAVSLASGAELLAAGAVTLNNEVIFATSGSSTLATNGTLNVSNLNLDTTSANVVFGSAGETGAVVVGPVGADSSVTETTMLDVAFGTLRNGGGLNYFTGTAASTTVAAGATLSLNDQNLTVNDLLGAGSVTLGAKSATTLTLNAANFSGPISGAGQLIVNGSVTLTGASSYPGGTTISSGTLNIGNGGATGSIAGNVVDNAALVFDRNNAFTFAGSISGTGSVTQAGVGVLTLSGNNSYAGGTTIKAGALAITNGHALGTGTVNLTGGATLLGSGTVTLTNELAIPNDASVTIASSGTLSLSTLTLSGGYQELTFGTPTAAGVVNFLANGPDSSTALNFDLTLADGTLRNSGGLGYFTGPASSTTLKPGTTLSVNDQSMTVGNLLGSGSVTLGVKATTVLTLAGGNFAGVISGAGQVDLATGSADFTGANTYTGGTTIAVDATLHLGNGSAVGTITGNVVDNGTLTFEHNNALTFPGLISGSGTVDQFGLKTLTLGGQNTYSGGTTISSGAIAITNGNALGTGSVTFSNDTALYATGNVTLSNELIIPTSSTATVATTGTLNLSNLSLAYGATILLGSSGNSGVVNLLTNGPDSTAATNALIVIAAGTARNSGGLGYFTATAASTTVDTGATLSVNDQSITVNDLLGSGSVTLGVQSATTLTLNAANFAGPISGAGQLIVNGSVTLTGASSYTGGTTISSGTLVANNPSGSATGPGPIAIDHGATLGGRGSVSGALTLQSGGTIAPGVASPGVAGTKFHASSLLWEAGGTLEFQIGSTADQLLLAGALTKSGTGTFTIDLENAGIVAGNYPLITFASTSFSLSDFTVDFPTNFTGTLVETSTSLSIEDLHDPSPAAQLPAGNTPRDDFATTLGSDPSAAPNPDAVPSSDFPAHQSELQPTPEPSSALLLAFGGSILLGWRRRRGQPAIPAPMTDH